MRPPRLIARLGLSCLLGMSSSACSWSRFDDVTDDAPIVLLDKPGSMDEGFGNSLATASNGDSAEVLVGGRVGVSAAAVYDIGEGFSPGTTSLDSGYCSSGSSRCFLASSLAGFANAQGPDKERPLCFAVGSGELTGSGLVVRCQDTSQYTLDVPEAADELLSASLAQDEAEDFPMATDRSAHPALLAALPETHSAWFYPSSSLHFSELAAPGELSNDPSFGKALAVLSVSAGHVYAASVSGKSEVLLWKSDGTSSHYIGCLGGTPGFGRALAAGKVNLDEADDLVVSDDTNVHVIDGETLSALPETSSTECGFASLPAGALVGSFGCGWTRSLAGCAGGGFGAALAVGDLDGDGDGEVIVGAPNMTVRGQAGAGALLVFDADDPADALFADAKFLSSAEAGDGMGGAIVTPHIQGRDIIAAGAAGNGKVALFYCSPLLAKGAGGPRCP